MEARSGPSPVLGILQISDYIAQPAYGLVSYGKRHLRFWTMSHTASNGVLLNSNMAPTKSDVNCAIAVCGALGLVVAGMQAGTLEFWVQKKRKAGDQLEENSGNAKVLEARGSLVVTYNSLIDDSGKEESNHCSLRMPGTATCCSH